MSLESIVTLFISVFLGLQVLSLVDIWLENYRSWVLRLFLNTKATKYRADQFDDETNDKIKLLMTYHILVNVIFGVAVYYYFDHSSGIFFIIGSSLFSYLLNKRMNTLLEKAENTA